MTTKKEIADALLLLAASKGNSEAIDAVCEYAVTLTQNGVNNLIEALQSCKSSTEL